VVITVPLSMNRRPWCTRARGATRRRASMALYQVVASRPSSMPALARIIAPVQTVTLSCAALARSVTQRIIAGSVVTTSLPPPGRRMMSVGGASAIE
jgi:hypothetical protein